jgi:hypothetical protein
MVDVCTNLKHFEFWKLPMFSLGTELAGQVRHAVAPLFEYIPGSHPTHEEAPALENVPGVHVWHWELFPAPQVPAEQF